MTLHTDANDFPAHFTVLAFFLTERFFFPRQIYSNMQKQLLLLFVTLITFGTLNAQTIKETKTLNAADQEIIKLSQQILNYNQTGNPDDNSLSAWNDQLSAKILEYGLKNPAFMQQNFPLWRNNGIELVSSADKNIRIVSWNAQTGGTLRDYTTLIFWKGTTGLKGKVVDYLENSSVAQIKAFKKADGTTFYLLRGMVHASNRDKVDFIQGLQLKGNVLNNKYEAFKTPKKKLAEISVELDMGSVTSDNDFIHFSKDNKTLLIPVANDKQEIKKNYFLIYQFDGNDFVFQKTGYFK